MSTCKRHAFGQDFAWNILAPVWEGRQGAEAAPVSSGANVPLSHSATGRGPQCTIPPEKPVRMSNTSTRTEPLCPSSPVRPPPLRCVKQGRYTKGATYTFAEPL